METSNSSLLLVPSRKKSNFPRRYPFPIIRNESEEGTISLLGWNCIIGELCEDCVLVKEKENMKLLFTMGFFGKGTLSKSAPQVVLGGSFEKIAESSAKKRKASESSVDEDSDSIVEEDEIEVVECTSDEQTEKPKRKKRKEIEIVLSDSSSIDSEETAVSSSTPVALEPGYSKETIIDPQPQFEKESLQLSFEEAYFLSYGLGCLVVRDKDQPLDLMRLWHKFCELTPTDDFPVLYTAYHHFRSKGWIVRSGLKYGVNYLLYKDGPPFYHSTYAVIVKFVKEQNLRDTNIDGRQQMSWSSLAALNRIVSHASKALMFLYVIKPHMISDNKIATPYCVSQFKLEEVLFKRWVPEENREDDV